MTEAAIRALSRRVYYGWVVVAVLTVSSFTQVGEFNPVLAVFMKPFGEEFGWTRAEVSLGISLGSFGGGLIGPIMGPLIDRHGSRALLVACQMVFGTCLLLLTFLNGSLLYFLVAYSAGRMLVQGGTSLATQAAIANWFIRYRGRAMGITAVGVRIGQATLPPAVAFITEFAGWRYAWLFLGSLVWVVGILPCVLFLRRRPEDLGLLPDGDTSAEVRGLRTESQPHPPGDRGDTQSSVLSTQSFTVREALRSRALWFLLLASCQSYFVGAGLNLHLFPYLTDVGLTLSEAVAVSSAFFAISAFGSVGWGFLTDRFPLRYCLSASFAISALGIVLLLLVRSFPAGLLFALVYGMSFGGLNIMMSTMWAVYFGRANVGAISGVMLPVQLVANAVGPYFGGWTYDQQGSYAAAFAVFAVFAGTGLLWPLLAGPPIAVRRM